MSKPDDIPQDVWDATMEICDEIPYGQGPAVTICAEQIARAILAAKAEEREACAAIAEGHGRAIRLGGINAWHGPATIAAAIRKRGGE